MCSLSPRRAVNDLFSTGELDHEATEGNWTVYTIFFSLTYLTVAKFFLTLVSITLPVPCGLYTPIFCAGAAFGRLFGEVMRLWLGETLLPGGYAVVGAAALCGGVTRAISSAVFVFELTGELTHIMPVMCGVIVAVGVGNFLSPSIYDSILEINKLPYFYTNDSDPVFSLKACDIMRSPVMHLKETATYQDIQDLLEQRKRLHQTDSITLLDEVPIVDSEMLLLGAIKSQHLVEIVHEVQHESPGDQPIERVMQQEAGLCWRQDIAEFMRGPDTLMYNCPVYKVTVHFIMLQNNYSFVVEKGKLIGVVEKETLMKVGGTINIDDFATMEERIEEQRLRAESGQSIPLFTPRTQAGLGIGASEHELELEVVKPDVHAQLN